eukprot:365998-Chlamydomonas_euryale.AAC.2
MWRRPRWPRRGASVATIARTCIATQASRQNSMWRSNSRTAAFTALLGAPLPHPVRNRLVKVFRWISGQVENLSIELDVGRRIITVQGHQTQIEDDAMNAEGFSFSLRQPSGSDRALPLTPHLQQLQAVERARRKCNMEKERAPRT